MPSPHEFRSFPELYSEWLGELLPLHLQGYLRQLADEELDKPEVTTQELDITLQNYDLKIEIAYTSALDQNLAASPRNVLYQIAEAKFRKNKKPKDAGFPILFNYLHFPQSPALKIVDGDPNHHYLGYRMFTDAFTYEEAPQIVKALNEEAISLGDLTEWQRSRVIPSTYLIKLPQFATANPNAKIRYENQKVGIRSPLYPDLTKIESKIYGTFIPDMERFSFEASLRSARIRSRIEHSDIVINAILATQLIQKTQKLESVEQLYAYLENNQLDIDYDSLQLVLTMLLNNTLHISELISSGIVGETFSLADYYPTISKWLVVCAQILLTKNKSPHLILPLSYTETTIPVSFIPHAMNSFLLFALDLPPLLKQLSEDGRNVKSPWPKLLAAGRHMIGDRPDGQKRAEDLIVSYFDQVILGKMNGYFEKKYHQAVEKWHLESESNPDLPYPKQITVTRDTMADHIKNIPPKLRQKILDQIPEIEKTKDLIEKILIFYGKNPTYLSLGHTTDNKEKAVVSDIADHLTKHGLRTAINHAGGRSNLSSWAKDLFQED